MQERHKGEAIERGGLGRKVGLGEQCLSFDILFLATPFLLHLPSPTSHFSLNSGRVSACASTYIFARVAARVSFIGIRRSVEIKRRKEM